jgi:menaquinone-specific isochorismate synthase
MTFVGATPERLLTRRGSRLRTVALAGSTRRGETPATDRQLRAQLRSDSKTDREHALVTATVREQLQAHARSINVGDRSIRRLPRVQHVRTPVTADVTADTPFFSLVAALYPTAAISGSPPAAARRLVADLESFDRGWYTGLVGYCDGTGDGTVAVGIRSALVGDHQARLFAGAGIVAESEPTAEWDETQLKYQPMCELFNGRTEP